MPVNDDDRRRAQLLIESAWHHARQHPNDAMKVSEVAAYFTASREAETRRVVKWLRDEAEKWGGLLGSAYRQAANTLEAALGPSPQPER